MIQWQDWMCPEREAELLLPWDALPAYARPDISTRGMHYDGEVEEIRIKLDDSIPLIDDLSQLRLLDEVVQDLKDLDIEQMCELNDALEACEEVHDRCAEYIKKYKDGVTTILVEAIKRARKAELKVQESNKWRLSLVRRGPILVDVGGRDGKQAARLSY